MARVLAALLCAAVLALGFGSPVEARKKPRAAVKKDKDPGDGTTGVKVREPQVDEPAAPQQGYAGVTLHGGEPPDMKPPPSGLQAVTWPGFRADTNGSEVFLQLTGQVAYSQKVKGRRVSITLERTMVPLRNNLRPVITRNFKSPVSSFRLRRIGTDKVRLDITLRSKVEPAVSMTPRGKFTFLLVAFPPVGST